MSALNIFFSLKNIFMSQKSYPFIEDQPKIVMSTIKKGTEEIIKAKSKLDYSWRDSIFSLELSFNYGITSSDELFKLTTLLCEEKLFLKLTKYKMKKSEGSIESECKFIPEVIKIPSVLKSHLDFEISLIHNYFGTSFDTLNEGCIYFSIHRTIESKIFDHSTIKSVVEDFITMLGLSDKNELEQFGFRFSIESDSDLILDTDILPIGTVNTEMFRFIFDTKDYSLSVVFVDVNDYYC